MTNIKQILGDTLKSYKYDSYCGIYCGACDIMMSYKTGSELKLASFWNEPTVKTFHKKLGIQYDENKPFTYKCNGCKSEVLFVNCSVCKIRECAINERVEHCIDCDKYPCKQIVDSKKIEFLLPHFRCNHTNMETVKRNGTLHWLLEQENKWKCPSCKKGFSWYTRKCKNCGKDLKDFTFKFSKLQSIILKLSISLYSGRNK
jgi:hypothetical protein